MYSLLVTYQAEDRSQGAFDISKSRFLEYTSESISSQMQSLSIEAKECIKWWPCLLMQEGRGQEEAYVVQITGIELEGASLSLTISPLPSSFTIVNDALWKARADLDIEQFEFNRNHWAIKDRELFPVLAASGFPFDASVVSRFKNNPLPIPPRSALISARDSIAEWSHTVIDDFLLEAGVRGLAAGREVGSRRERANEIVKFAIKKPGALTAENSLFSAFIVRRVTSPIDNLKVSDVLPRREEHESSNRTPNRVFVVHGQDNSARSAVVSFLSRIGLEGIVLHDQPNMGRHLLTKFIEEADLVTFAIVLMTDDDVGSLKGGDLEPRARQNVILELGYFLSHLGQQRVCALITPGLETPSDFDGIVYIRMDKSGRWEVELARELRAAGMPLIEDSGSNSAF